MEIVPLAVTEVLLPTGYDVIVSYPPGGASGFYSNLLPGMHGFRDNEVLLQAGYDVIVISPLGGASGDFS